jgi:beta-lactam-binding protein with PASTA domain
MQWPLLVSVVAVVAITAVYFVWLRKPAAPKQDQQPQG